MWLLWAGLAVLFGGLYAGTYVWMRRPKFGEDLHVVVDRPGPATADGDERHDGAEEE